MSKYSPNQGEKILFVTKKPSRIDLAVEIDIGNKVWIKDENHPLGSWNATVRKVYEKKIDVWGKKGVLMDDVITRFIAKEIIRENQNILRNKAVSQFHEYKTKAYTQVVVDADVLKLIKLAVLNETDLFREKYPWKTSKFRKNICYSKVWVPIEWTYNFFSPGEFLRDPEDLSLTWEQCAFIQKWTIN